MLVPADEHRDAAFHDVEPGLVLLGQIGALPGDVGALLRHAPRKKGRRLGTAAAAVTGPCRAASHQERRVRGAAAAAAASHLGGETPRDVALRG